MKDSSKMINSGEVYTSKFAHFFETKPGRELSLCILEGGCLMNSGKSSKRHILSYHVGRNREIINLDDFDGLIILPPTKIGAMAIADLIFTQTTVLFLDTALNPQYLMQNADNFIGETHLD